MLFVDPKTVTRWARAGKLDAIRTPGGHRRYRTSDVVAIMAGSYRGVDEPGSPVPAQVGADDEAPVATGSLRHTAPADASSAEATALALEAEAERATQSVLEAAAAVTAAAEKAAAASARARAARAHAASLADQSVSEVGPEVGTEARPEMSTATGPDLRRKSSADVQVPSQRGSVNQDFCPA